jgi:hypothetical protein
MENVSESIIQRITLAFKWRELPEDDPIFISNYFEIDVTKIDRLARQTTWVDFPKEVLRDNPLALGYMTPNAFAWFLPAFLIISVSEYAETDTLINSILSFLTPPVEADAIEFETLVEEIQILDPDLIVEDDGAEALRANDPLLQLFRDRAAVLTLDEKIAVRYYLEYLDTEHGEDFPVFSPKQALQRFWAQK